MNIEVLEEAGQDLAEGYRFYEAQGDGLGDYFIDSVMADIESLMLYAGVHATHFGYHRLLVKRFPFAVYYKVVHEVIQVWAVLDCRRDPHRTVQRLSGRQE